jgi:hypothetical protein
MKKLIFALASLLLISIESKAANFYVAKEGANRVLYISGEILPSDTKRFFSLVIEHNDVNVIDLNSGGGVVNDGMAMAQFINFKGYTTRIRAKSRCFSICSVMFLSGSKKLIHKDGYLGVHTAFNGKTNERDDKINSYIAWYFGRIGYDAGLVTMWLESEPSSVNFITAQINMKLNLGIESLK